MTRIALIADSSNDLPPEVLDRYAIQVVPLLIHFGEEEVLDLPQHRELFWARLAAGEAPRSAAPSPAAFAEAYERALARADRVLAITLTSKHSSTYQNARLAAEAFGGRVSVFDSWGISLGEGMLVLRAAEMIDVGMDMATILHHLEDLRARMRLMLYIHSLEAIQRSGRIALAMNVVKRMSSLLSIRILLEMREGVLTFAGAVRGPRKGMQQIVQRFQGVRAEMVAVAHTRTPDMAQRLADQLAASLDYPRDEVLVAEAGPVLGVHGGAGAFGAGVILRSESE